MKKAKGLVPYLIAETDWKAINTLCTPTISPNTSNQNFEIAIVFKVVERSGNYVFGEEIPPTALRASVVSYALGDIRFLQKVLS
jgi:hypothetical protein